MIATSVQDRDAENSHVKSEKGLDPSHSIRVRTYGEREREKETVSRGTYGRTNAVSKYLGCTRYNARGSSKTVPALRGTSRPPLSLFLSLSSRDGRTDMACVGDADVKHVAAAIKPSTVSLRVIIIVGLSVDPRRGATLNRNRNSKPRT